MTQPTPPARPPGQDGAPQGGGRRTAMTDWQLADLLAERCGCGYAIGGLDDVEDLAAAASAVLDDHQATHLISSVAVWPLGDGSGEALITVDRPLGPRLCTLTVKRQVFAGLTARQALARLLEIARAEIRRLEAYLAAGGAHQDLDRLRAETAAVTAAASTLDEGALGDLVHDVASRLASDANNGDLGEQAAFLVRHLGPAGAIAAIEAARPGSRDDQDGRDGDDHGNQDGPAVTAGKSPGAPPG